MGDDKEADRQTVLAQKFSQLADMITSRMMKFADDVEGYFDDAAEVVDPKTLLARSKKKTKPGSKNL